MCPACAIQKKNTYFAEFNSIRRIERKITEVSVSIEGLTICYWAYQTWQQWQWEAPSHISCLPGDGPPLPAQAEPALLPCGWRYLQLGPCLLDCPVWGQDTRYEVAWNYYPTTLSAGKRYKRIWWILCLLALYCWMIKYFGLCMAICS